MRSLPFDMFLVFYFHSFLPWQSSWFVLGLWLYLFILKTMILYHVLEWFSIFHLLLSYCIQDRFFY
jgi:hypothetical protein